MKPKMIKMVAKELNTGNKTLKFSITRLKELIDASQMDVEVKEQINGCFETIDSSLENQKNWIKGM